MGISNSISRCVDYCERHGFWAMVCRAGLGVRRVLFASRMAILYCDIPAHSLPIPDLPAAIRVERKRNEGDLSQPDLQQITAVWNPRIAQRNIEKRFGLGASLWLIKFEERLAGYGWTLQGGTVEPHYLRLGKKDVHFFDFYVFPAFRGQGLNPLLLADILRRLGTECGRRAFIEAAEWNHSQLASLTKTPFCLLGCARKFTILGHTIVWWTRGQSVEQKHESERAPLTATANKRSGIPDLHA